jgi:hypothetical protein
MACQPPAPEWPRWSRPTSLEPSPCVWLLFGSTLAIALTTALTTALATALTTALTIALTTALMEQNKSGIVLYFYVD